MTARTAYGLDTPRGMHWADLAACSRATNPGVDPEWWWPTPANHVVSANTLRALHICRVHCPVQDSCHRDAVTSPPTHPCVQGGDRYVMASGGGRVFRSPRTEPDVSLGCPYCAGGASC